MYLLSLLLTYYLQLDEGEDVFELYDDAEYQKLVEERRKTNDFVVDDGILYLYVISTLDKRYRSLWQKIWDITTMARSISVL